MLVSVGAGIVEGLDKARIAHAEVLDLGMFRMLNACHEVLRGEKIQAHVRESSNRVRVSGGTIASR